MKQIASVMTRKGQVTIPIEVRRTLGLRRGDRVVFVLNKEKVSLKKVESVVDRTAGSMKSEATPVSTEREREIIEQLIAEAAEERAAS